MSLGKILGLVAVAIVMTACSEQEQATTESAVRPVKIFTVEGGRSASVRRFPGVVDASQRAELAFRVPGSVQQLSVREGDLVNRGQLLAKLDPTDFAITLKDRTATTENAARNFRRAKELVKDGNISRLDFDRMEAQMKTTAAALAQAEQDLAYTELKAPFTGRIAVRHIENFEEIIAGQKIFRLQNDGDLEIKIALPETLVRMLNPGPDDVRRNKVKAQASFEGRPDDSFPLTIKEISTRADSQTQTFQVTLGMAAPDDFAVLPGMTATVALDLSRLMNTAAVHWVPVRAVVAESELKAQVWVLDSETMTVSSRQVEIGRMSGTQIEVKSGLQGDEELVSVGASYLAEGMKVTRMIQSEQAIPRVDDPA
ncbi:MAG: efflux RND transporter periplasmic adaptor subunit [Oceanicoccus sp.]